MISCSYLHQAIGVASLSVLWLDGCSRLHLTDRLHQVTGSCLCLSSCPCSSLGLSFCCSFLFFFAVLCSVSLTGGWSCLAFGFSFILAGCICPVVHLPPLVPLSSGPCCVSLSFLFSDGCFSLAWVLPLCALSPPLFSGSLSPLLLLFVFFFGGCCRCPLRGGWRMVAKRAFLSFLFLFVFFFLAALLRLCVRFFCRCPLSPPLSFFFFHGLVDPSVVVSL